MKKPVLRYKEGSTVVPGDRIGTVRQARPGAGMCVRGGHIYANLLGKLALTEDTPGFVCSILSSKPLATNQVLKVGQRVVGRVSRITPQNALVEIRVAEGVGPLRLPYCEGAIRLEDVRSFSSSSSSSTTKEENNATGTATATVLGDCFRPGDLVACRVVSMGDSRRYFLTTAETELGVIRAQRKGVPMIPVSWKEMECPETGVREPRKCAKPVLS
eukprot:jgi/Psemu1/179017/e_gw1.7.234.1